MFELLTNGLVLIGIPLSECSVKPFTSQSSNPYLVHGVGYSNKRPTLTDDAAPSIAVKKYRVPDLKTVPRTRFFINSHISREVGMKLNGI